MNRKNCPHCAELIHPMALYCRYCRQQTFNFKIYMSDKDWFAGESIGFIFGFVGIWIVGRIAFMVSIDSWRYDTQSAFIFAIFCVVVYFATILTIAYFYYYSEYQEELKKRIRDNVNMKEEYTTFSVDRKPAKTVKSISPSIKEKEDTFKTTKIDRINEQTQSKKSKSSDLADAGFKVVKKSKE